MADEVLRAVLVDPDALHADGAEDSRDEDPLVHFNADPLVFELVFTETRQIQKVLHLRL